MCGSGVHIGFRPLCAGPAPSEYIPSTGSYFRGRPVKSRIMASSYGRLAAYSVEKPVFTEGLEIDF